MRSRASQHDLDRFFSKVDASGVCWEWTGGHSRGYGRFWHQGSMVPAHRWIYEQLVRQLRASEMPDHLCRNPSCVCPDHLEPVSNAENGRRGRTGQWQRDPIWCRNRHDKRVVGTYRDGGCLECRRESVRRMRSRV